MKKTKKKNKYDYLALLLLLVIGYATNGLSIAYARAIDINRAVESQNALQARLDAMTVPELIDYIAPQYGADKELIKKITYCESRHLDLPHDGGLGKGVTGYHKKTFEYHKELFNRPDLNYESTFDQIAMMSIAFNAGEKYRNLWTTYVAYKNGGTYSFYSRTMNGYFTAKCK